MCSCFWRGVFGKELCLKGSVFVESKRKRDFRSAGPRMTSCIVSIFVYVFALQEEKEKRSEIACVTRSLCIH